MLIMHCAKINVYGFIFRQENYIKIDIGAGETFLENEKI